MKSRPKSQFVVGKAIRGGVPVIFPWFGPRAGDPTAPEHGFARVADWAVDSVVHAHDGSVAVTLRLDSSDATRAAWPYDFCLRHRVVFGSRLEMTLEVENLGRVAFSFEEALHTYLRVGDVRQATITGLEETSYIDKIDGLKRKRLGEQPMRLDGVTDRVFMATRATCAVDDPVLRRRLVVEKSGSATTVVWNPWSEKAAAMADLGADTWPSMLCVETANVADDAVSLAAGERHRMAAVVSSRMSPALRVTARL